MQEACRPRSGQTVSLCPAEAGVERVRTYGRAAHDSRREPGRGSGLHGMPVVRRVVIILIALRSHLHSS